MEQTVNTFGKGLQMDTHPMVQGNETLSDALNATFITMNGNEIVLQNDMGNRRVDNAYLPPGYTPVGMKEYGGIIYVASYNPITNKSQIGSFPSPQKKIDLNENKPGKEFDFDSFFETLNVVKDSYLGIKVLNSDSFMIPITSDTSLHAGDKFVVYSQGGDISFSKDNVWIKNNISNFYNTENNKVKSPKNKNYTIQIGILNSQNEFVDITKSLCRWEQVGNKYLPVNFNNGVSDIYKFNYNYFIPSSFSYNISHDTINDTELIKKRQTIPANTYAYKLVGPMYMKITYNHIQGFNYNIYGVYDRSTKKATLWLEGFITYNCPDNRNNITRDSNTNFDYITFDETKSEDLKNNFKPFRLLKKGTSHQEDYDSNKTTFTDSVYNVNNNTYTTSSVREYQNITATDGTIYEYVIGVLADPSDTNQGVYLRGLSVKGSINLELLGSGTLDITEWKFYNDVENKITYLTISFDAYPKFKQKFTNLRFKFKDITDSSSVYYYPLNPNNNEYYNGNLPIYNGRQTINLNWDQIGLNPRKVYEVSIYYDTIDDKGKFILSSQLTDISRWILTTALFNDFYNDNIGINDYCKINHDTENKIEQAFIDRMKISIIKNDNSIENNSTKDKETYRGRIINTSPDSEVYYTCNQKYKLNISVNPKPTFNEELYPDFINIKDEYKDKYGIIEVQKVTYYKFGDTDLTGENDKYEKCNELIKNIIDCVQGSDNNQNFDDDSFIDFNKNDDSKIRETGRITGYITYKDILKGRTSSTPIEEVENVFGEFCDEENIEKVCSGPGTYSFVGMLNEDDTHYYYVAYKRTSPILANSEDKVNDNYVDLVTPQTDTDQRIFINDSQRIYNLFNENLNVNSGITLLFGFPTALHYYNDTGNGSNDSGSDFRNNPRVYYEYYNDYSDSNDYYNKTIENNSKTVRIVNNNPIDPHILSSVDTLKLDTKYHNKKIIEEGDRIRVDDASIIPSSIYVQPTQANSGFCRVWWRTDSDSWALIPKLFFIYPNYQTPEYIEGKIRDFQLYDNLQGSTNYINSNCYKLLAKFIKKHYLPHGCVYCIYDYGFDYNIYSIKDNYIYNKKYNIPFTLKVKYQFKSNVEILKGLQTQYGNLKFYEKHDEINSDEIQFDLNSSDKFQERIQDNINIDKISNVFIDNKVIITEDSSGRSLNSNCIYQLSENNELIRLQKPNFTIDRTHKCSDGRNTLVYSGKDTKWTNEVYPYIYDYENTQSNRSRYEYTGAYIVQPLIYINEENE